jgi:hypothetical protein
VLAPRLGAASAKTRMQGVDASTRMNAVVDVSVLNLQLNLMAIDSEFQ